MGAWSLCFAMLWPHGNETRKPSKAIGARLLVTLVPLLVVPSILCRGMPPSTYHALTGFTHIAYVLLTLVFAMISFRQLEPIQEKRPLPNSESLPENVDGDAPSTQLAEGEPARGFGTKFFNLINRV